MDNEKQLQAQQNHTQHGNSSIINDLSLFSSPSAAWSLSKHTGTITTQPVLVTSDPAIANHILSEKVQNNSSNQFAPVATENARDLTKKKKQNKIVKLML